MSDYQAIYDAVRSRISGGNIGDVVADAARSAFDISFAVEIVKQEFCVAAAEMARPSAVFKPVLSRDGNMWCALLGENIAEGLCAFGDTPAEAMANFDKAFQNERIPIRRKDEMMALHDRTMAMLTEAEQVPA